jgi:molybdenum cofactor sulfurtransferase
MENPYNRFIQKYPEYESTASIDELRATDYSRIDRTGQVYLDYTGGGLYADSQVMKHQKLLLEGVFGNPHSTNPTSLAATELIECARAYVLEFFKASPDEYDVVFTPNASGALKLVGESYPFTRESRYLLTFDNHNSVNGIREFAHARGADVKYVPVALPDLRVLDEQIDAALGESDPSANNLFAYPAQSNFSSVQHPLEWIERAQSAGWDVLLDAAAFAPTSFLDLSRFKPDFVPLSFYKMFGYPTGLGALIARVDKLHKLQRPWFAGGTITVASVQGDKYYLADGHAAFRRRHRRLSRYPSRGDRPAPSRVDRHGFDQKARPIPDRMAAGEPDRDGAQLRCKTGQRLRANRYRCARRRGHCQFF